jgi:Tfp pilus assembly protein PilV
MRHHQQGSALISVLIILLVITVLGVIAIRQGLTSLNLSTSTQVQALLFQSADYGIDQVYLNLDSSKDVIDSQSAFGIIGFTLLSGNEVVFCLPANKNLEDLFNSPSSLGQNKINDAGVLSNQNNDSYCDVTDANDFSSGRKANITQLALMVPTDADTGLPFATALEATDADAVFGSNSSDSTNQQSKPVRLRVYATTVAPALSQQADATQVNACLRLLNDRSRAVEASNADTVTDCLTRQAVPFATHTEEYLMRNTSTRNRND